MTDKNKLILEIISSIETSPRFMVSDIGSVFERVSNGVYKLRPYNQVAKHILVNETSFPIIELNYFFGEADFSLSELMTSLGNPEIHYNFRDNYTEFKFSVSLKRIKKIYLIKENKIEFSKSGVLKEKTPRGEEKLLPELRFNLICVDVDVNE